MITLFEYLANHSPNRSIDKVFIGWYRDTYSLAYIQRKKEEWDSIYKEFSGEKELDPKKPAKAVEVIIPFKPEVKPVNKGEK